MAIVLKELRMISPKKIKLNIGYNKFKPDHF